MTTLDAFACIRSAVGAGMAPGALADELARLDAAGWKQLDRMRRELRRELGRPALAEAHVLLALVVSDDEWATITKLREALKLADDTGNEELRRMIACTLDSALRPQLPAAMARIDDPLPGDDASADAEVDRARRRFHQRYIALKARAGLSTIQEVAQRAGISPTTVHAIETQAVRPQFRTVRKLAAAFGAPVTELWG